MGQMEDIMAVIFTSVKGRHLNMVKKYHIYKKTEKHMQISDTSSITTNKI
jgi:hypothetical protein